MIAFAYLGPDGIPTGGGIRPSLPEGAVALTEPFTTRDLLRLRWTGEEWVLRAVVAEPVTDAGAVLAQARAEAVARVNRAVDARRCSEVTGIAGQEALYQAKEAEAAAFVREVEMGGAPDPAGFPLLAGEVGVTAETAWQLAQLWLHLAARSRALVAATEALRHRALAEIAAAPDFDRLDRIAADLAQDLADLRP